MKNILFTISIFLIVLSGCNLNQIQQKDTLMNESPIKNELWQHKQFNIDYNNKNIKVFINKPLGDEFDAILMFHGTTMNNTRSIKSAMDISTLGNEITNNTDKFMTISVAYKESNLLIGDELEEAETSLLWLKNKIYDDLNITINKIYLFGHSRGGYIVLRLNNKYKTDGVIANAPGPISLDYLCLLVEQKIIIDKEDSVCNNMRNLFGTTNENPDEYTKRSLLYNIDNLQSRMLIIQGLDDKNIQLKLMPQLLDKINKCKNCANFELLKLNNTPHWSFNQNITIDKIRNFIN